MSNARNLANLLGTDTQIQSADIADEAVTIGKLNDNATQLFGMRNLIINGAMQVWQRGTSINGGSIGGFVRLADRFWLYGPTTTSGTVSQSTDVPSNQGLSYSIHNDTDNACSIGANVELPNTGDAGIFYSGQNLILSLWVKGTSSIATTIFYSFRDNAGGTGSIVAATNGTLNITTEWNRVEIPLTITATPNANNRAFQLEFSMPAGLKVTGVQLEVGDTATPFEHRSYGQELALCQRYYVVLDNCQGGGSAQGRGTGYSRYYGHSWTLPVEMRTDPDILQNIGIISDHTGVRTFSATTNQYRAEHGNTSALYSYWEGDVKLEAEL
jgi:hypothetical protein